MGNRSVVGPAWWHVYTADDPERAASSILFWLVIFTVWTLGRTSPICAGQHHLNAPTSNGIYTKRPLIVQSTGLFSSRPFPLASVYSQLISRRNFQILLKLVEKLSFDIFHARIGRSYGSVRFTAARRNKGLSGSWFRHKREKDGFADLLFSVYPHHHHLFFFFNFVNVRKERKRDKHFALIFIFLSV
jgi:hypothetical protein